MFFYLAVVVFTHHHSSLCSLSLLQFLNRYRLLQRCPRLDPFRALFLLDSRFPDPKLRAFAVRSLEALSDYSLSQLMLQLVQVLKFEPSHDSFLGRFLLRRALLNPPIVGHALYWMLYAEKNVNDRHRHCRVLLELFLRKCGEKYRTEIGHQQFLLKELSAISDTVRNRNELEYRNKHQNDKNDKGPFSLRSFLLLHHFIVYIRLLFLPSSRSAPLLQPHLATKPCVTCYPSSCCPAASTCL
jgi:hypothetical protein